ncbi:hypothetical protein [Haliangium ochraceum]|uniref:DUF2157 domain-containing protein n=1 Tax=Haliangium ochraceum (strain DSM 14365 / JCM 11303 / SMP-2) TaxID=502025 RepID=D0LP02_HALO1|nr:hypothetical protein [Haliangium ochraceum]ACY18828.1 hypothetical protein Hoch_6358 [Haliangium ochraceum DSM 14365]
MRDRDQIAIIERALRRWRRAQLIDAATYQRLWAAREDAAAHEDTTAPALGASAPAPADPASAAHAALAEAVADAAVVADIAILDRAAGNRPLDIETRVGPELERELLGEVAFHEQLAASMPAGDAPGEVVAAHQQEAARRIVERDSLWSRAIRPFLLANAFWLAGALLIVTGSIYFLQLAWEHLPSVPLHAVVAATLHGYGAAFFGVGYLLCRKREAYGVGRILCAFAFALLPLGSVAVGEFGRVAVDNAGALGAGLALLAAALALALQGFIIAVVAGLYERGAMRPTLVAGLGLALLTMLAPTVAMLWRPLQAAVPAAAPLLVLGLVALGWGFALLVRGRVLLHMSVQLFGGAMLWSFLVLLVHAQLSDPVPVYFLAPVAAALAVLLVRADHGLRMLLAEQPRLTGWGSGFYALAGLALVSAVLALDGRGLFVSVRLNVLACAIAATGLYAQAAARYGAAPFTWLACAAGLLLYYFLPAPFTGLLDYLRSAAESSLGYGDEPLPLAFYGLTLSPYLAILIALERKLAPRRDDIARALQRCVLALSALLVLLPLEAIETDLRPAAWTWPLFVAGAFVAARVYARPWLRYLGHLGAILSLIVLARLLVPALAPGPLLGIHALAFALLALRWRSRPHLAFAAALGAVAALLSLALTPSLLRRDPTWTELLATLSLSGVSCALLAHRLGSRIAAYIASAHALGLAITACIAAGASSGAGVAVFCALTALAAAIAWRTRDQPDDARAVRLLANPASDGAVVSVLVAALVALVGGAILTIPVALCAAALAVGTRNARTTAVAALAFALSVGVVLERYGHHVWRLGEVVAGCALLLVAARIPSTWPRYIRRHAALTLIGLGVVGLGLYGCVQLMSEVAGEVTWTSHTFAGLCAVSLALARLWWTRARWTRLWAALWPPLALLAAQAGAIAAAAALSTGRHPDAAVAAPMALSALLSALGFDLLARRLHRQASAPPRPGVARLPAYAQIALYAAAGLSFAAILGCLPQRPAVVHAIGFGTLAAVALRLWMLGRKRLESRWYWTLLALATGGYLLLRKATALASLDPALDVAVAVVAGHIALWTPHALRLQPLAHPARRPLRAAALLWPFAALIQLSALTTPGLIALFLALSAHHAIAAWRWPQRALWLLALACGDVALLAFWEYLGWTAYLLYTLPVTLSLLLATHLYGVLLRQRGRHLGRSAVLLLFFGIALQQALSAVQPVQGLVLVPILCLVALAAGTVLRVRAYALTGVAFLALDLAAHLLRYGLESRILGAVFLTALGLVVIACMVVFSLERERLLRRYSAIIGQLRTWD